MATLCLLGDDGTTTKRWEIRDQPLAVGRDQSADIQINDESLSRLHFSIAREGTHFLLKDLKSQNGTSVDGKPVRTPVKLRHHDCIVAGRTVFVFSEPAVKPAPTIIKPLALPRDTATIPAV